MPSRIPSSLASNYLRRHINRQPLLPLPPLRQVSTCSRSLSSFHIKNVKLTSATCNTTLTSRMTNQNYSTTPGTKKLEPTSLTPSAYHVLSSDTLDTLLSSLEDLAESSPSPESNGQTITDVEFSAGVLAVVVEGMGTWVVNKQPPNKQVWLSSPVSGPRRFDWVVSEEGWGRWLCLREGDEVGLGELLRKELGSGVRVGEEREEEKEQE